MNIQWLEDFLSDFKRYAAAKEKGEPIPMSNSHIRNVLEQAAVQLPKESSIGYRKDEEIHDCGNPEEENEAGGQSFDEHLESIKRD